MSPYDIAVLPGDGIGPEVVDVALEVVDAACAVACGPDLRYERLDSSSTRWMRRGEAMSDQQFGVCAAADAIFLGAIGLLEARHSDGREVNGDVIFRLRFGLDLFAGIRPVRLFPGVTSPLKDFDDGGRSIDYVVVRENVEGLYAGRSGGIIMRDALATDTLVITREGTQRVVAEACRQMRQRPGRPSDGRHVLTCVDKGNVLTSYAFFRDVATAAAREAGAEMDHAYIDAMAAQLVQRPDTVDVIVTENMFGDILSDLAAATVGGLGMAPSADLGDASGLFQPAHGSAPDIAGTGTANPVATVLSAAMMLDWLAQRHGDQTAYDAARLVEDAVTETLAAGKVRTPDLGGRSSTRQVGDALCTGIKQRREAR